MSSSRDQGRGTRGGRRARPGAPERRARARRRALPALGGGAGAQPARRRASCSPPPSSRRPATSSSASASRRRSTSVRCASVRPLAVPGARATDLSGAFLRAVAELGAHAEHRRSRVPGDAAVDRRRSVLGHRRAGVPAADAAAGAHPGRRRVGRQRHQPVRLRVRFRGDVDHRGRARRSRAGAVRPLARRRRPCAGDRARGRDGRRARARGRDAARRTAVAVVLLSCTRVRHRQRRDAVRRHRPRRRVRRVVRAEPGHGAGVRARDLGGRQRGAPVRGDRRGHRRTATSGCRRARRARREIRARDARRGARRDGGSRRRRDGARPGGERTSRRGHETAVARGHACVRTGLCRRTRAGRGPRAREQRRRRARRVPGRAAVRHHVEPGEVGRARSPRFRACRRPAASPSTA